MTSWTIYEKANSPIEVVKSGFNWCAFFFGGIWAFIKGLNVAGAIGVAVVIFANRLPPEADLIAMPLMTAFVLLYGFKGNSWVCAHLEAKGYLSRGEREAASAAGAKANYQRESEKRAPPPVLSDAVPNLAKRPPNQLGP